MCFPYRLALCFANVLVGCLVSGLSLGLVGQSCGVHILVGFPLQTLFCLGRVVFMYGFVCVCVCVFSI